MTSVQKMKVTAGMQAHRKDKAYYEEGREALKGTAMQENPMSTCHQEEDMLQAEEEQQSKERLDKESRKARMTVKPR